MEDLGKEVDEYFAKKYPIETKKVLCHQCGGAVGNSLQQLKAELAALVAKFESSHQTVYLVPCHRDIIKKLRKLSAV